jgi:hypothetical protein
MVFLCFGAAPPDSQSGRQTFAAPGTLAAIVSDFCGHDPQSIACHAPTNCCRPDAAVLPTRSLLAGSAFAAPLRVAYGSVKALPLAALVPAGFRSRAPPV